jgi:flagellar export protein FliJ
MTGFAFRLQNVLDYRMSLVDRARFELAALQVLLDDAEAILAALQQLSRDALAELMATQTSAILDVAEITRLLEYGEVVASQIVEQRQVIEARRAAMHEQQQIVIGLARDAKALEKLRDRQVEEFQQEDARRERSETSEIASTRHQRFQVSRP